MIHWSQCKRIRYKTYRWRKTNYVDLTITLDTEASSYYCIDGDWISDDGQHNLTTADDRIALTYIWMISIDDVTYYGRELSELRTFLIRLSAMFGGNTAIIYVHNLGYDFEFFGGLFVGWDVFARKSHKPIYARLPSLNLEIRCSLMLTGMSLDKSAKSCGARQKMVGGLDYKMARNPNTPLTDRELAYCERDVQALVDIINVYKRKYGCIANVPLTQTGEVRREVRKLLSDFNYLQRIKQAHNNFDNYRHLTRLFSGGVTHCNYLYNGVLLHDVKSYDRRSSYPAVMALEMYPMSAFTQCRADQLDTEYYCYYGLLRITNLRSHCAWDYISVHKCERIVNGKCDNGKLFRADYAEIWVTDVDYDIIRTIYPPNGEYNQFEWGDTYRAIKSYLPLPFVQYILQLYSDKTTLKNVAGREDDYLKSKQYINSLYGMTVTNNIRGDVIYDDQHDWSEMTLTDDDIQARLADEKPFLPYSVGVWVTAYARRELMMMIAKMGNDCVYCDTDSVKGINADAWEHHIDDYNKTLYDKIHMVCQLRGLDESLFFPSAPDGTVCPLGEFALDGVYSDFKSFGAKKYCVVENGKFHPTIAGCEKQWLEYHDDGTTTAHPTLSSMDDFRLDAVYQHARKIHWYTNNQPSAVLTDYLGNTYQYSGGGSGVVIMDSTYSMGLSDMYLQFLRNPVTATPSNKYTDYIHRDKL